MAKELQNVRERERNRPADSLFVKSCWAAADGVMYGCVYMSKCWYALAFGAL